MDPTEATAADHRQAAATLLRDRDGWMLCTVCGTVRIPKDPTERGTVDAAMDSHAAWHREQASQDA
jgi:hypothetical protein